MKKNKAQSTSWGAVADWYDDLLTRPDSYQEKVIWPNLKRILGDIKNKKILDIGCGHGFFSLKIAAIGAEVIGIDISEELISKAKKESSTNGLSAEFYVSPAHKIDFIHDNSCDVVIMILSAQNIKELDLVFGQCARVLKKTGRFIIVLNHPAFRIPQFSDWYFNAKTSIQGRLVNRYLSEIKIHITMHPGQKQSPTTVSFHRPLQVYMKWLAKNGFAISHIEEWISHKKSEPSGMRAMAENAARKEIPLFLCVEACGR